MINFSHRDQLASQIRDLIQEFENLSDGEIKQNNLAKLLGVSEPTISRAKSSIYNMRINQYLGGIDKGPGRTLGGIQKRP